MNTLVLGEDMYIQGILRDVTEEKKMKKVLEKREDQLQNAQKMARLGWWQYNVPADRILWSGVLYEILGVDRDTTDHTLDSFRELVVREDREKLKKVMDALRSTRDAIDYELRIQRLQNGEIICIKCRAEGEFDTNGELIKIKGVAQDITEQKRAQEELVRNKELFQSLFLNAPEAIAMVDLDGCVRMINRSFEKLFGYTEDELAGRHLLEVQLPEERQGEIEGTIEDFFTESMGTRFYEDQHMTKSGEMKDLIIGTLPVTIDGEIIAAFSIFTDITKLKEIEANLQQFLREKEVMLSEIHHRVKNNLAIISGLLELESLNWEEGSATNKVLTQCKLRVHSMAKIHEKLYQSKDFSTLKLEDYVSDLVDTIVNSMNLRDKDLELNINCDDESLNINQALPTALIINELVSNSLKYAFEEDGKGMLDVQLKREGQNMNIVVEDDGKGLPNSFDEMTKKSLGHNLVNQLVKQLEGDITVQSSENKGTRYEIRYEKKQKKGSASHHSV